MAAKALAHPIKNSESLPSMNRNLSIELSKRFGGTKNIEGILLDPKLKLWDPREREYTIEMGTKAFRKMAKLRLLEIHYTRIPKGPDYLPNELRWIDWDEYPSNYLPTTFEADNLVGLRLCWSRLRQLWEERTNPLLHQNLSTELNKLLQLKMSCSETGCALQH
ncbi:hypothetical protein LguiA_007252 [Lonicera macranthoides]